jgi:negative regulator of flagellin synthesis FlgM
MNIHSLSTDAASRAYIQSSDAARANTAGRAKDAEQGAAAKASRVDSVVLSDNAKSLAAARDAVNSADDIRHEKVADIKQRLSDGTYSVDAKVLARKMLQDNQ